MVSELRASPGAAEGGGEGAQGCDDSIVKGLSRCAAHPPRPSCPQTPRSRLSGDVCATRTTPAALRRTPPRSPPQRRASNSGPKEPGRNARPSASGICGPDIEPGALARAVITHKKQISEPWAAPPRPPARGVVGGKRG